MSVPPIRRPHRPRRGVTLVEMLVVVALVVLMMVILVQIFQSATGAMSASRTSTELDLVLRQVDGIIRSDLNGVTAKMTPPNDPKDKSGYFEYAENAPADAQGEDTDDTLAFTTKAPEGSVFSGRQWLSEIDPVSKKQLINQSIQPTTITSQVGEVIYFLRNGNLYRRVFLVAPDRAKSIAQSQGTVGSGGYITPMFGGSIRVSWQGMNDISCRPGSYSAAGVLPPIPNDLGDLTNRENRAFSLRFLNDFYGSAGTGADGVADDNNADGLPDYYPTLYTDGAGYNQTLSDGTKIGWAPNVHVHEGQAYGGGVRIQPANLYDAYAFPFLYPGMYSVADPNRLGTNLGAIHSLAPNGLLNHSPLDIGDNLAAPGKQTWWGRPTWRETMTGFVSATQVGWGDPFNFFGRTANQQPLGLQQPSPLTGTNPAITSANYLPPITAPGSLAQPPFSDGAGSASFVAIPGAANRVWEDDLVLTNVRSFDVKAYDLYAGLYNTTINGFFSAGYQDLGYGANPYIPDTANPGKFVLGSYVGGPHGTTYNATQTAVPWQAVGGEPVGFGHEGRIPSLSGDYRMHPRRPYVYNNSGTLVPYNIGDDSKGVIRLNRTFDTWSTDYVNAPDSDLFLDNFSSTSLAIYPSFPPPYPSPLRGIQIQIRVVDPRGERSKVLTIRHDFTDKLTN